VTTRILSALASADEPVLLKAFPAAFPWMKFLPPGDAHAFVEEFTETARACAELGSLGALGPVIEAWRATAEIHADPALLKSLTAPLDGADHGTCPGGLQRVSPKRGDRVASPPRAAGVGCAVRRHPGG